MDLDHLRVPVVDSLLVTDADGAPRIDNGVGAKTEDQAVATGANDGGVAGKSLDIHRSKVLGGDAAASAVAVLDDAQELPTFVLLYLATCLESTDLFVQRIKKLLAGSRSGIGGSMKEGPAKAAERQESLTGSIERYAHSVKQVDDRWGTLGHPHDGWLVVEEVASRNRVFKV
jgi:hypothetical protein